MNRFVFLIALCYGTCSYALTWDDLWYRKDQQGQQAFAKGHPDKAAKLFTSSQWKASALYRSGQYDDALTFFQQDDSPQAHYNRGNTLAQLGQFPQAIAAYEQALKQQPDFPDATHNKTLLEKLMQDNKQQDKHSQDKNSSKQNKSEQEESGQEKSEQQEPQGEKSSDSNQEQSQQKDKQDSDPSNQNSQNQQTPQTFQEQATEQWLRRIPDDPGGLLQRKFLRDHRRYQQEATQ